MLTAYIGDRPIAPLLLTSLVLQEPYSGAHATGMGVIDNRVLKIEKDFGHVARVKKNTNIELLKGTAGIAHSRYSSKLIRDPRYNNKEMAHPFVDDAETIALMHNGDFGNYKEHWKSLRGNHTFRSYSPEVNDITDSEIAIHMLSDVLAEGKTMEQGLQSIAPQLTGTFLISCITTKQPETVWIANWHQRCVVALGEDEAMFCSSHIGFSDILEEIDRIFEPPKNSLLKLTRGHVDVMPLDTNRRVPNINFNMNELAGQIISLLIKKGEQDFKEIEQGINSESLAKVLGVTPRRWNQYKEAGVSIVSLFIKTLDMLIREGKIRKRVDKRFEGGVFSTPRYSFYLTSSYDN